MQIPKILYVIINYEGANDIGIKFIVINMHVLESVVLENILEEALIIFLAHIVITLNPPQVLQGNDVISLVGDFFTVQVSQINTLVHVRYFNMICS